jgi:hypothetical protein
MIAARVPVLVTLLVGFAMLGGSITRSTSSPQEARARMRSVVTVQEVERADVSCHTCAPHAPVRSDASARCVDPAQAQIDPFAH